MSFVFNQEWLDETINEQFSSWVRSLKDPIRVLCCFCQWSFALSNMGKRALESHMNSDKHKRNVSAKVPSITLYLKNRLLRQKPLFPTLLILTLIHKPPVLLQLKQIECQ